MTPEPVPVLVPDPKHRPRRWLLAVLVLLIAGGAAAAYLGLIHDWNAVRPGAAVVYHVVPTQPRVLGHISFDPAEFEAFCQSQISLIKNRRTLSVALNDPQVRECQLVRDQPDPLAWLEENLQVSFDQGYMRVVLTAEPVEEAITVLGAIAKAYEGTVADRSFGVGQARLELLQREHKDLNKSMDSIQLEIDIIAKSLGALDATTLPALQQRRLQRIEELQIELERIGKQITRFDSLISAATPQGAREQLLAREAELRTELSDVITAHTKTVQYMRDIEKLGKGLRIKEALAAELGDTIERSRIELKAPPRVTLWEEAHAIGAQ